MTKAHFSLVRLVVNDCVKCSSGLKRFSSKRGGWLYVGKEKEASGWRLGVKYDHLRSANKVGLSWHYRSSRKAKMLSSSLPPSTLAKKGVWNEVFLYESMGLSFPVGCDPLLSFFCSKPKIFITTSICLSIIIHTLQMSSKLVFIRIEIWNNVKRKKFLLTEIPKIRLQKTKPRLHLKNISI